MQRSRTAGIWWESKAEAFPLCFAATGQNLIFCNCLVGHLTGMGAYIACLCLAFALFLHVQREEVHLHHCPCASLTLFFSRGNRLIWNVCLNPLWKYQFMGRLKLQNSSLGFLPESLLQLFQRKPQGNPWVGLQKSWGLWDANTADALSGAVWRAEGMVCMQWLCFSAEQTSPLGTSEAAKCEYVCLLVFYIGFESIIFGFCLTWILTVLDRVSLHSYGWLGTHVEQISLKFLSAGLRVVPPHLVSQC